jgi:hypothetical protein
MSIGTNILIKYNDKIHLETKEILVAPCNLYQALATIVNRIEGTHWNIEIIPSFTEYFLGE